MLPILDKKTRERLAQYCGRDPLARGTVTVRVLNVSHYDFDRLPNAPAEFIEIIKTACDQAPAEYRGTLSFSLEFEQDYHDSSASAEMIISYVRPETDDEITARIKQGLRYISESENRERQEFERLREKFS